MNVPSIKKTSGRIQQDFKASMLAGRDAIGDLIENWCEEYKIKPHSAFCLICECVINVGDRGRDSIVEHANNKSHHKASSKHRDSNGILTTLKRSQQVISFGNASREHEPHSWRSRSLEDNVTVAETMWVSMVAMANIPFQTSDLGYDMEDAMIINKSAFERGFGHGSILKSDFIELNSSESYFGLDPNLPNLTETLDEDGLPRPGDILKGGDTFCCWYSYEDSKFKTQKVSTKESVVYIDNVRLCGGTPRKACITFRVPRNPTVGDKFASRAGQKGICSWLWPSEDLPFTQAGLVPDIVFNPHGFPSRMTIAMMIELLAGKSAAVHGLVHDATPFRFNEEDTAIDYFGRMLEAGGYDYYGKEKMYSGTNGRELEAHIFFGIVHYQRLRHMVSDKWQVRSTGPVDILTQQPVKGRRRGGGVRFGEMERDALLSHGASFLLQDRLFHCSDKTTSLVCKKCGSIISSYVMPSTSTREERPWCQICREDGDVGELEIPYIFRYLVTQFAAVNIKVVLEFNDNKTTYN